MAPDLASAFHRKRQEFLRQGLADTKKWCVPPDETVGNRRSDQYWLSRFSPGSEDLGDNDMHEFLVGFQLTNRVSWRKQMATVVVNDLRTQPAEPVDRMIENLAEKLRECISSAQAGRQTSAASKIAVFAKPEAEVFIWDRLVRKAASMRSSLIGGRRPPRFCSSNPYVHHGGHDYPSFIADCRTELTHERSSTDFRRAVGDLVAHFANLKGPLAQQNDVMRGFIERRLLDKMMFWEGRWLEEQHRPRRRPSRRLHPTGRPQMCG